MDDLAADDFERLRAELARRMGPGPLGNEIQCVRALFKYGYDVGLIDRPVRVRAGIQEAEPEDAAGRAAGAAPACSRRRSCGPCSTPRRSRSCALLLLGVNCGLGNTDLARMPLSALDLDGGWVNVRASQDRHRPAPPALAADGADGRRGPGRAAGAAGPGRRGAGVPDAAGGRGSACGRPRGRRKARRRPSRCRFDDSVSKETRKLLRRLGLARPWLNFYALRHNFETVGGETGDQVAVDAIMGHARDDMASTYRERISDERLTAVNDRVRAWLFPREYVTNRPRSAGQS